MDSELNVQYRQDPAWVIQFSSTSFPFKIDIKLLTL